MYATVRNQGTGSSAATPVSFYLSTDATISTSDTRIDGQYVRRLAPSETGAVQVTATAQSIPGTYYYGACVQTVSGETDTTNNCSAAVAVTVGDVDTAPAAPTGLSATADGQTEIDLSWAAPSDDGGATITGYKIEVSTNGSSWSDLVANTRSTSASYTHTGLAVGSARYYRVSAINSAGTGTASNTANATTDSQSNRAPVAIGTIPAWTSAPYGFERIVVSSYFSDPDNDVLTYSAASSDPTVATSEIVLRGSVLIRAVALGTATVTVTARDPSGLEATQTIRVAVKSRPEALGTISSQTIEVGQTITVDVSPYFRDQDGDLLSYRVETSNANEVTVSVSGSTVSITGVSMAFVTWVTVIARDPDGNEARQRFSVGVRAPATDGTCTVGLIVRPGESCTYPGRSDEFSVDSTGRGHFQVSSSPTRIDARNSTFNGVAYNFLASKQSDGNWLVEEVG